MGKRAISPPPVDDTDDVFVRFLEYVRLHPSRELERKARLYAAYLHRSHKPLIQFSLRTLFVSTSVLAFLMGLHQFDEPLFYFLGFLSVVVPIIACVLYAPILCIIGLIVFAAGKRESGASMTQLGLRIVAAAAFATFCLIVFSALTI
jgi:hypothetical protein